MRCVAWLHWCFVRLAVERCGHADRHLFREKKILTSMYATVWFWTQKSSRVALIVICFRNHTLGYGRQNKWQSAWPTFTKLLQVSNLTDLRSCWRPNKEEERRSQKTLGQRRRSVIKTLHELGTVSLMKFSSSIKMQIAVFAAWFISHV